MEKLYVKTSNLDMTAKVPIMSVYEATSNDSSHILYNWLILIRKLIPDKKVPQIKERLVFENTLAYKISKMLAIPHLVGAMNIRYAPVVGGNSQSA